MPSFRPERRVYAVTLFGIVAVYAIAPVVILGIASLSSKGLEGYLETLTLKWYAILFTRPVFWEALYTSALLASIVGCICVLLGFCTARLVVRLCRGGRLAVMLFVSVPVLLPSLVSAFSLHAYFSWIGLDGSVLALACAHIGYASPIAFFVIYLSQSELDPDLDHCARNLGASEIQLSLRIVAPQLRHACLGAGTICALLSWDEFILAWFVGGFHKTVPILVNGMLGSTIDPSLYALGTLVMLISATLIAVAALVMRTQLIQFLERR